MGEWMSIDFEGWTNISARPSVQWELGPAGGAQQAQGGMLDGTHAVQLNSADVGLPDRR